MNGVQKDCTGTIIPDSTVELIGFRSFGIDFKGRLSALRYPQYWTPEENIAKCLLGKGAPGIGADNDRRHPRVGRTTVPHPDCTCGFYSFWYTNKDMFDGTYDWANEPDWREMGRVDGVVACYGRVLVGTKGMRAEKGRIIAISTGTIKADVLENFKSLYPNVKMYKNRDLMLEAHPTYKPNVEVEGPALWEWDL